MDRRIFSCAWGRWQSRVLRSGVAVFLLPLLASTSYGLPMLSVDVDPGTSGIQSSRTVQAGNTFSVDIHIGGVIGLFAYDLDVDHDPTRLDATDATEGSFLAAAGPTFFDAIHSSNPVNAAATLLGVTSGASGSGVLFSIQYTAIAPGGGSLDFTFVDLLDDQFAPIDVAMVGGSISVVAQGVPLPSTLGLFGFGLFVCVVVRYRTL